MRNETDEQDAVRLGGTTQGVAVVPLPLMSPPSVGAACVWLRRGCGVASGSASG